jgi:hypothetical protein
MSAVGAKPVSGGMDIVEVEGQDAQEEEDRVGSCWEGTQNCLNETFSRRNIQVALLCSVSFLIGTIAGMAKCEVAWEEVFLKNCGKP